MGDAHDACGCTDAATRLCWHSQCAVAEAVRRGSGLMADCDKCGVTLEVEDTQAGHGIAKRAAVNCGYAAAVVTLVLVAMVLMGYVYKVAVAANDYYEHRNATRLAALQFGSTANSMHPGWAPGFKHTALGAALTVVLAIIALFFSCIGRLIWMFVGPCARPVLARFFGRRFVVGKAEAGARRPKRA